MAVAIPGNNLGVTVAPKLEVGYRLDDSLGQLSLAYRFVASDGTGGRVVDGIPLNSRSRLSLNQFDLDYGTAPYSPEPHWNLQSRVGIRLGSVYYDTRQCNDFLEQRESNYFLGAGPHASLTVERQLILSNFAVFAKVDGAVLVGQTRQNFTTNVTDVFDASLQPPRKTLTVPTLQVQVGLSYTPSGMDWLHFRAGYQWEEWFNLGNVQNSHLDLSLQGGFLGGEINF